MSFTGAAMLWVGWFGFNAGSALAADGAAGMALFVTHISASVGALTWIVIEWLKYGKPSGLGAITGMVAGLATITPASGSVGPAGALLVGLSGGVICYYATSYLKQGLKIDDSLDVFPVHGVGGIVGTFLPAFWCQQISASFPATAWQREQPSARKSEYRLPELSPPAYTPPF